MPKKIAQTILQTFRAARWQGTGGQPVCPRCFDGEDLTPGYHRCAPHLAVRAYHCRCCRYEFTDLTGSPLEKTSRPLSLWAWLVLGGDPAQLRLPIGRSGSQRDRLRQMATRLAETALAAEWRCSLEAAGITRQRLDPLVEAWAASEGTTPRGRHAAARRPARRGTA